MSDESTLAVNIAASRGSWHPAGIYCLWETLDDISRLPLAQLIFGRDNECYDLLKFLNSLVEVNRDILKVSDLAHGHVECDVVVVSCRVGNFREILNVVMVRTQLIECLDAESASCPIWKFD